MINCPNCGFLNSEGSAVCGNCGSSLINGTNNSQSLGTPSVNIQYTDNYSNSNFNPNGDLDINPEFTNNMEVGNMDENFNSNQMSQESNYEKVPFDFDSVQNATESNVVVSDDDRFIDSYIGKNVSKVKKAKVSIWAFFFGPLYLWYRKMYKLFGIVLGVNLLVSTIFSLLNIPLATVVIMIIIDLGLGFKFQDLYLKEVNKSVDKIKNSNQEKNEEDIINICSKKGGITIVPMIVGAVLVVMVMVFAIFGGIHSQSGQPASTEDKKSSMIDDATRAIAAVRDDVTVNNLNSTSKIYSLDELNQLLETPLDTSSYGVVYTDVKVQATKMLNGNYMYRICMVDENSNGFGYTYENSLSIDIVLEGSAPNSCE